MRSCVFLPVRHHKLCTYSVYDKLYYKLCKCCSHTRLNLSVINPPVLHWHVACTQAASVYCIIVCPSSPIAHFIPCTPLIRMILQTFLHLICHSAISSFALIFILGLLSHPELPACRFASPFLFLSSSAKNRNDADASQQLSHIIPLVCCFPIKMVVKFLLN